MTNNNVDNNIITSPFNLFSWNYMKNINGFKIFRPL